MQQARSGISSHRTRELAPQFLQGTLQFQCAPSQPLQIDGHGIAKSHRLGILAVGATDLGGVGIGFRQPRQLLQTVSQLGHQELFDSAAQAQQMGVRKNVVGSRSQVNEAADLRRTVAGVDVDQRLQVMANSGLFGLKLLQRHLTGGLARIAFEEVRSHAGTDAAHLYGGFLAHLSAWCEERGVAYEGVPVGTIKRFATGRGNADKAAMIAAVRARGFAPADDNEADAIALLLWATDPQGGRA